MASRHAASAIGTRRGTRSRSARALPGQLLGILDGGDGDVLAAHAEALVRVAHRRRREGAVYGVVLQQMREGLGVREIVDVHDLDVRLLALGQRPNDAAANTSKSVDRDLRCHPKLLTVWALGPASTPSFPATGISLPLTSVRGSERSDGIEHGQGGWRELPRRHKQQSNQ